MPALTRRRNHGALRETWLVYWGDVHAGNYHAEASAIPTPPLAMAVWIRDPSLGKRKNGTAASFEATRSAFETGMGRVSVEANRSRLQGMARSARLDRAEICAMGKPANGRRRSGLTA
jgi:hypothetical protein